MALYLGKRLLWALVTLWGVTAITFLVVYQMPADPAALLGGPSAPPETIAAIRRDLGLDQPLITQYSAYIGRLLQGDLGVSYITREPVAKIIGERLPATALLALSGWLVWLGIGLPIGAWVAARRSPVATGALLCLSILGVSIPSFWLGILLLSLFAARWQLLPAGGYGTVAHLVLPVITLSVSGVAYYARLVHSSVTQTLDEDYIRTARAKGAGPGRILWQHALRNSLLPVVTVAGTDLAALLGGVVFTESVFQWPGMGKLAVDRVFQLDIPVILGIVLVAATFVVAANLAVDLIYPTLDPRIRGAHSSARV